MVITSCGYWPLEGAGTRDAAEESPAVQGTPHSGGPPSRRLQSVAAEPWLGVPIRYGVVSDPPRLRVGPGQGSGKNPPVKVSVGGTRNQPFSLTL